ncbi:MAG TPA: efflux RND transporter periplasmic adaptor subunit [Vicinamibacterales bacterium]
MRSVHLLVVGVSLAIAGCNSGQAAGPGNGRGRGRGGPAVQIETATISRMSIERHADLSGTLVSPDQAKVSSEVAGIVREVPVQLGTEIRAGDTLVRLEPRELSLALERADSALKQVEAQLGLTRSDGEQVPPDEEVATVRQAAANRDDAKAAYDRAQQLNGRGLLSKVDRDTAETRMKVMEANYQAAVDNVRALRATLQDRRASYDLAVKKLNDAVIKAPVAGSVSERLVQPGEFIRENTQVVTIVQMNPLKLRTSIQEKFAGMIRQGQDVKFSVEAFPDRTFDGKVAYVSPAVDQTTRTFAIESLVDNPDRVLKPGFFAKGTIALKVDDNVMVVPDDTVSTLAGVSTVYVIEDAKARQQIVTLGSHEGKKWEIVEGLKGNEVLASSQLNQLATGMSVNTGGGENRGGGAGGGGGRGRGRGRGEGQGQAQGGGQ